MSSEGKTMTKFYQIINNQYQPVRVFQGLDNAKEYVKELQQTYKEAFYIVEMPIVFAAPAIT